MANFFDQFDEKPKVEEKNFFDRFDQGDERARLKEQGRRSVEESMTAPPEYVEVPSYDPTGVYIGTERVLKPSKADPLGRGALGVLPFGEDLGALARSQQSGRTLAQEKMIMEGEREAAKEAYPGAYLAGQAAGIVPQLYLPGGLAARGTTALGKTALGAAEGALYGGVTGLGEGITAEERLGSAATGAGFGGVLGGALGRFAKTAPKAPEAPSVAVEAAERLGVELPLYAATDNMLLQRATKVAENMPFAGEPAMAARTRAIETMEEAIDRFLPRTNVENAGESIRTGIENWMNVKSKQAAKDAYDEVTGLFNNPDVTRQLENTRNAVAEIMARQAQSRLGSTPAVDLVMPAVMAKEGLSYEGAKNLYTRLRELRDENRIKGVKSADVERLYRSLKNDVLDIAEQAGGEPARFFLQRADRKYAADMAMKEQLQKIVGAREGRVSDEQIFERLYRAAGSKSSADAKLVSRAMRVMDPEHIQSFQAGLMSRLGRDAEGNFSPDRWLGPNGISGLSDRAKKMIFKDNPQQLQVLEDITEVSRRFKNLNKFGNPSGTGQTILGGTSIAGLFVDPISVFTSIGGANLFTRAISKPATAESLANWSRRYEAFVQNPTRATANAFYRAGLPLSRMLSAELNKEVDINDYISPSAPK